MNEGYVCPRCGRTWYAIDCMNQVCTPPEPTYRRYHTQLENLWGMRQKVLFPKRK